MSDIEKFKNKIYTWLVKITKEGHLPDNCQAIYIGLFENKEYMIHFLGSVEFDKKNNDWACESKEDYYPQNRYLSSGISTNKDWKLFFNDVIKIIKELKDDQNIVLSQVNNIAVGFDSGDLTYI